MKDMAKVLKLLYWVGNSLKDLKRMPEQVREKFGHALYVAQKGEKHRTAKPLKGFSASGVFEIVEDFKRNTYRAVYAVKIGDAIYVLHVFQKKSKQGISTPMQDIQLIEGRLIQAQEIHQKRDQK